MSRRIGLLVLVGILGSAVTATACLWDHDTLAQERRRFPSTLELISGKFLRHSDEFYRWRISDRKLQIQTNPDPALVDDLAVAYDKLGEHALAIETMRPVLEQFPERYEAIANLGTFYIHNGDYERGLEFIRRAIEINPNAHFGREIYQQRLVEYVLKCRQDGGTDLPLGKREELQPGRTFAEFLRENAGEGETADLHAALRGVMGMLRLGDHKSPILLEALGDLLLAVPNNEDAKQLAARAYLKASYEVGDMQIRQAYQQKAAAAIHSHRMTLESLEAEFARELENANLWYAGVGEDEQNWIQAGGDVEAAFAAKYYVEPTIRRPVWPQVKRFLVRYWEPIFLVVLVVVFVMGVVRVIKMCGHQLRDLREASRVEEQKAVKP